MVLVLLSPKFQLHETMVPNKMVDESVNVVISLRQTVVLLNAANGEGCAVTVCVIVSVQPNPDVAMSVTVYVPADAYACEGLCAFEVLLSPKSQVHVVMLPELIVLRSLK